MIFPALTAMWARDVAFPDPVPMQCPWAETTTLLAWLNRI